MLLVEVRPRTTSGLRSVALLKLWFAFVGSLYVWDRLVTSVLVRSDTRTVTEFVSSPIHLPSFSLPSNACQMRSRLRSEVYSPSSNCLIIAKTAGSCSNCRPMGAAGPDEASICLSNRSAILDLVWRNFDRCGRMQHMSMRSLYPHPDLFQHRSITGNSFRMLHKLIFSLYQVTDF